MTEYRLMAACLPGAAAEQAQLAGVLPARHASAHGPKAEVLPREAIGVDAGGCAVLAWARSGLMELTGCAAGPPLAPVAPILARAAAVLSALGNFPGQKPDMPPEFELRAVLAGRAAEAGWQRQGTVSANGTCRLLPAADGWLAVNLARPADVSSLPAVLRRDVTGDPWDELRSEAASRAAAVCARAQACPWVSMV